MEHWVERGQLRVEPRVARWIERRGAPAAGIAAEEIWKGLEVLDLRFNARVAHLISARSARQSATDAWHAAKPRRAAADRAGWLAHLARIGWMLPETAALPRVPAGLSAELRGCTAPHLVVALSDAAAVDQAMAGRWVTLDVPGAGPGRPWGDPARVLDRAVPLARGSWADAEAIEPGQDGLLVGRPGAMAPLAWPHQWRGTRPAGEIVLKARGQHLIVAPPAPGLPGPGEVRLEVAPSVRLELEGWAVLSDAGARMAAWQRFADAHARPDPGLPFRRPDGAPDALPALPRVTAGVAGLCDTMALAEDGEGRLIAPLILDMLALALSVRAATRPGGRNGAGGGAARAPLVLCLPELDGPEEMALAADIAEAVEALLELPRRRLLLGLVALRRRTEVNLGACIAAADGRLAHLGIGGAAALSDALRLHREAGRLPAPEALAAAPWAEETERRRRAIARAHGLTEGAQVAGTGPDLSPLARDPAEALAFALEGLTGTDRAIPDPAPGGEAVPDAPEDRGPMIGPVLSPEVAQARAQALAARRLLAHAAVWVGEGTGRAELTDPDGAREVLCPARARAEALWLVNQQRHGALTSSALLRLLRREAAALDADALARGKAPPFGPDCATHAFQAACDLVFREGDWPVGDALAVLRERRMETLEQH